MVRKAVLFGILAFGLIYGTLVVINAIAVSNKGSAEQQIRYAIEEMRQATLDGRDGGVLEYLSDSFQLPDGLRSVPGPFSSDRSSAGDFVRNATVDSLTLDVRSITVQDGLAIAEVPASGKLSYPPFLTGYEFNFPEFQIEFKRESRRRLLIVPDPTWVVIRVHGVSAGDLQQ